MAELPDMIDDLALILVVAGFVTLLFKKLKQPLDGLISGCCSFCSHSALISLLRRF